MIERSKERLFEIAAIWGLDEKTTIKLVKNGDKKPFCIEKWDYYLKVIKRNAKCPWCGKLLIGPYPNNIYICETRRHRNIWPLVMVLLGGSPPDKVLEYIMQKCEHDVYRLECDVCMDSLIEERNN